MTIVLDDLPALERQVEKLRRDGDRAAGIYQERLAQIKARFGCKDLQEAERLLAKMKDEEIGLLAKYNRARKEFEKKWKTVLDQV